jgi:hypothetical protein
MENALRVIILVAGIMLVYWFVQIVKDIIAFENNVRRATYKDGDVVYLTITPKGVTCNRNPVTPCIEGNLRGVVTLPLLNGMYEIRLPQGRFDQEYVLCHESILSCMPPHINVIGPMH